MSSTGIKHFGTASYDIKGAIGILTRVEPGMGTAEVLEIANDSLSHAPQSHKKAIRGALVSSLLEFDDRRKVIATPILGFTPRVDNYFARREVILYHVLKYNYTLHKIAEFTRKMFEGKDIDRKTVIKYIFDQTKSEKGSQYTVQKAFRILKDYELIARTQPDRPMVKAPEAQSLAFMIYREFAEGENPVPLLSEVAKNEFLYACYFTTEGILSVIDDHENEWWYCEKTGKNIRLTFRYSDCAEFVQNLS